MSDIRFNQWLHNSGTGGVSQVDGGHVGIGTTNPLIPVGAGVTAVLNVGVVTANYYYGDGSNLSGIVGGGTSLSFNDNIGAYFGNTQDLKIHHDGNHSYIDDQGTGNLRFRSGTLEILNLAGNKTSAIFSSGGGQTLNFNNSTKFVTTNTGAIVTGIVTATSRVSLGNNTTNAVDLEFGTNRGSAGDTLANINWKWNNTYVAQIRGMAGSDTTNKDDAHLNFYTASAGSLVERLRIASDGKVKIGGGTASLALLHIAPADYSLNLQNNSNNKSMILFAKNGIPNDSRSWIEGNGELNGYVSIGAGDNERLRITSGGNVNIGADFSQSTHMLSLSSTGDAGIHIRADSSNTSGAGENYNPYLSMSQDGSNAQLFKLGMVGDAGNEFAQSIANAPFVHANTANVQPLQLAHMNNLAVTISAIESTHFHSYSGNNTGGLKIANRGNDTGAALLLQGHNNTGSPGQATNTQLTHKGANATFNIKHLGTDRLVIGSTGVVSGNLNNTSDIALKKDIESISTSCIDNIKQLNPVTFKWKDTSKKDIGFIAQEVEDILPDLVNGEDGVKSINTIGLVSQLTKALQEAITEIETLKTRVATLEGS